MGSLPNKTPKTTNGGLIKSTDEQPITNGTLRKLSDGNGNELGASISTDKLKADAKFYIETVDAGDATNQAALFRDSATGEIKYRNVSDFATNGGAYDTGWLDFDTYDGGSTTWGLLTLANEPNRPQFRIIGRTVHFKGSLVVPLESGGSLVSDYSNYITTNSVDIASSASGVVVRASGNVLFPTLFNNSGAQSILAPDSSKFFSFRRGVRSLTAANDANESIMARCFPSVRYNTDGTMDIITIFDSEDRDSTATFQGDNILREITTVANAGDFTLVYGDASTSSVRTSWNGNVGSPVSYRSNYDFSSATLEYPVSINLTRGDNFGGLVINLDGTFYHISKDTSVDSIHALFP